jgi:hypothetical protein
VSHPQRLHFASGVYSMTSHPYRMLTLPFLLRQWYVTIYVPRWHDGRQTE